MLDFSQQGDSISAHNADPACAWSAHTGVVDHHKHANNHEWVRHHQCATIGLRPDGYRRVEHDWARCSHWYGRAKEKPPGRPEGSEAAASATAAGGPRPRRPRCSPPAAPGPGRPSSSCRSPAAGRTATRPGRSGGAVGRNDQRRLDEVRPVTPDVQVRRGFPGFELFAVQE